MKKIFLSVVAITGLVLTTGAQVKPVLTAKIKKI